MIFTPPADKRISRLIDANLDRAREGLRVIEDWCRFGLERKDLVLKIKDWRHQLSKHHHETYKSARSSSTDQGALLNHPLQENRKTPNDIVFANCSRIQEALRVLEEFCRESNPALAKAAAIIRYEIYEFEITILKENNKKKRLELLKKCNLCLITSPEKNLVQIVSLAIKAGIKMVQYRCKDLPDKEKIIEAKELATLCKKQNVLFIINDRIDFLLATDADGIHLGQDDIPLEIARNLIGTDRLIGKSTQDINQIQKAAKDGIDYIGIGPVFPSKNKPLKKAIGLDVLIKASRETNLPCFAIGGIKISNIDKVLTTGIKRIAIIDAIMKATDPSLETNKLLKKLL